MKKWIALALCVLMAVCMIACDKEAETTKKEGGQPSPAGVTYAVTYQNTTIELGGDAKDVIAALGTPTSQKEGGSCAGQGTLTVYTYPSLTVTVLTVGDKQTIDQLTFTDDGIKTAKGITIGSARDAVVKAYGEATTATDTVMTYTSGNKSLKIGLKDGFVKSIDFIQAT
ncbi:MAG: hypothetical protein E7664_05355 [Ruminococcaceae bacterium]|nr:hypothetical protein [Oscillospiraceae bacterium]